MAEREVSEFRSLDLILGSHWGQLILSIPRSTFEVIIWKLTGQLVYETRASTPQLSARTHDVNLHSETENTSVSIQLF